MSRHYSPFRDLTPWFRNLQEAQEREVAERRAWLAGVQKRLGLVTRENVDQLLEVRLEKIYG